MDSFYYILPVTENLSPFSFALHLDYDFLIQEFVPVVSQGFFPPPRAFNFPFLVVVVKIIMFHRYSIMFFSNCYNIHLHTYACTHTRAHTHIHTHTGFSCLFLISSSTLCLKMRPISLNFFESIKVFSQFKNMIHLSSIDIWENICYLFF